MPSGSPNSSPSKTARRCRIRAARSPMPPNSSAGTPRKRCAILARIRSHHLPARAFSFTTSQWASPFWSRPGTFRRQWPRAKSGRRTPLTMLALMPILEEAGVPAGVVNVIPSRSSGKVVSAMLHDARVRVVSFTGSTEVGRKLLHEAADCVVKPAMELGGNAPFIVFEDADIDAAIDGAMVAKMRNMGEACTAANRFYVHEKVHDEFAKKLTAKMGGLKMGNGLDDGVSLGPLVNKDGLDKVIELVDDAVKKGAKVLTGGKAPGGPGYFYPATVLANVSDDAKMLNEEIFGPVASIQSFKSEDEVISRANNTEYGLVAYLYTKDLSRGMRVSEKLDFGMVGLNRGLVSDPAAPFGGVKQSGLGREGAHEGLMEFTETQYISVTW